MKLKSKMVMCIYLSKSYENVVVSNAIIEEGPYL